MDNYKLERIEESNYYHLKFLFKKAFNIRRSLIFIKKKYNTLPFGIKNIGFFAVDEKNIPAAYYGVFPLIISINNQDFLVAQSGDTMTDPAHQKKGLFTKLAKQTYELAKGNGVNFVFGFPNKNSFPGFQNKLNWVFYGNIQEFKINNYAFPFCEITYKFSFLRNYFLTICKYNLASNTLPVNQENIKPFTYENENGQIKKDICFFEYKFSKNVFLVQKNSFLIFIKLDAHLLIGDVAPFERNRINNFLDFIGEIAKKTGSKKTVFSMSKNHWLYDYLNQKFIAKESSPIGFFNLSEKGFNFQKISFTLADFDTF